MVYLYTFQILYNSVVVVRLNGKTTIPTTIVCIIIGGDGVTLQMLTFIDACKVRSFVTTVTMVEITCRPLVSIYRPLHGISHICMVMHPRMTSVFTYLAAKLARRCPSSSMLK